MKDPASVENVIEYTGLFHNECCLYGRTGGFLHFRNEGMGCDELKMEKPSKWKN